MADQRTAPSGRTGADPHIAIVRGTETPIYDHLTHAVPGFADLLGKATAAPEPLTTDK